VEERNEDEEKEMKMSERQGAGERWRAENTVSPRLISHD